MAKVDNRPARFRKMVETLDRQRFSLAMKPAPRQKTAKDKRGNNMAHMDHLASVLAGMALAIEEGDQRVATYKTKADVEFVVVATPPHLKPLVAEMARKGSTWRIRQREAAKLGTDEVTCRVLAEDGDRIAPVSGCRCRGCGANARRRPVSEVWHIRDMAAWCPECAKTPAEVVVTYTNAPKEYDGFGTKTLVANFGEYADKTVRKVETPVEHLEWQRSRYASGCYCAMGEVDWSDNLKANIVMEWNQPVAAPVTEPVTGPVEPVVETPPEPEKPATAPVAEVVTEPVAAPAAKTKRLVLPTNLGDIAKCVNADNASARLGGQGGVQLKATDNGYRVAATDGKVAIIVSGVCQDADEYPAIEGETQWPNGETAVIIPPKPWVDAMAKAGKCRLQAKYKKVVAVLGKTMTTLASLNEQDVSLAQPRNVEGRFPSVERIIKHDTPTMKVRVNAKRLAAILTVLANLTDRGESEVVLELFDPKKAMQLRTYNTALEQEITALLMPIS